jgi:hypothetical protein
VHAVRVALVVQPLLQGTGGTGLEHSGPGSWRLCQHEGWQGLWSRRWLPIGAQQPMLQQHMGKPGRAP